MKFRYFFICFFIFTKFYIFSLDNTNDKIDDWKTQSKNFFKKIKAKDIANANLAELKSMLKSLGLKDFDNATECRNALYKYYNMEPFQKAPEKTGDKIILEKAGELKINKFTEDNEEILHLFGKVKLILNSKDEKKQQVTRSIEADEIYINLKNKEISGTGNVVFKDKELEFYGEEFYYNFKINRGVLYKGKTKLLKSTNTGLENSYFIGEKIIQTGKDDAILYNGQLTLCDEDNPHYFIKVSKIWINDKGEWGMEGGIIYIGTIPFFWIPIYYHPKNLKINPVIGYRSRESWFLNTTYYIFGDPKEAKKDSKDVFGVQQNRTEPSGERSFYTIKREDVNNYLDKFYNKYDFYKKYPQFRLKPQFDSIDMAARIFADAYVNLGFFFGSFYYLNYKDRTIPFTFRMLSDFAFSRLIWKDTGETDLYITYNPNDKNNINFNDKNLYLTNTYLSLSANPLIFRSSQWAKINGQLFPAYITCNFDAQIEYASDTDYYRDFYNRTIYFSYIDLMFNAIQYGVETKKDSSKAFKVATQETVSGNTNIQEYIKLDLSPKSIPNIYGFSPLSNISMNSDIRVTMTKTLIPDFNPAYYGGADHPLNERYMLDTFSVPAIDIRASGSLLDYDIFIAMPDKINKKNKENITDDEKKYNELFSEINVIKNSDASKDITEIDYKLLLPLISKKIKPVKKGDDRIKLKFNNPIFNEKDFNYKKKDNIKSTEKSKKKTKEDYQNIFLPNIMSNIPTTSSGIKLLDFDLNYNASNTFSNKFIFHHDYINDLTDDHPEWDTMEKIFNNSLNIDKILKQLNLNNFLSYSMRGSLFLFQFMDNTKLWSQSPSLSISYKKDLDDMGIYEQYLNRYYHYTQIDKTTGEQRKRLLLEKEKNVRIAKESKEKTNREQSELSIYYEDTIKNDLSFGYYLIEGTGFSTYMKFKLFRLNEQKKEQFRLLNDVNEGNKNYNPIDTDYYDNRDIYGKIDSLHTTFTLKFNLLPKNFNHSLNISAGPKINWIVPQTNINIMKSDIWLEYIKKSIPDSFSKETFENDILNKLSSSDKLIISSYYNFNTETNKYELKKKSVTNLTDPELYTIFDKLQNAHYDKLDVWYKDTRNLNDIKSYEAEAKEYIYFNDNKLYEKINKFYSSEEFWDGPKNFRKMFENISFNINYNYKLNNLNLISASSNITLKLENIGRFSKSVGKKEINNDYIVYPDLSFKLTLLNSMFDYSTSITFSKNYDTLLPNFSLLNSFQKELDENKYITMSNSHTFSFVLSGQLFPFKLKSGDWIKLSSTTTFKWDKNYKWISEFDNSNDVDYFLDTQSFNLNLFMNIINVGLTFRTFDFDKKGNGLELDTGFISIGYNITEIPTFLRYFKLTFYPLITYNFMVNHKNYYDGKNSATLEKDNIKPKTSEFDNSAYLSSNTLTHKISIDLIIGEKTDFETKIHFHATSINKKMYLYYTPKGLEDFFWDLLSSFNFFETSINQEDYNKFRKDYPKYKNRRQSNFNLQEVSVTLSHNIHDWSLSFTYTGSPQKSPITSKTYWENIFTFDVLWKISSDNQLLKMLNKTKINERYERGSWKDRTFILDSSEK